MTDELCDVCEGKRFVVYVQGGGFTGTPLTTGRKPCPSCERRRGERRTTAHDGGVYVRVDYIEALEAENALMRSVVDETPSTSLIAELRAEIERLRAESESEAVMRANAEKAALHAEIDR